jgi:ubiquinone/menaquinone biosynthesis C-methylase UbiE
MDLMKILSKTFNTIFWLTGTWQRRSNHIVNTILSLLEIEDKIILDFGCAGGETMKTIAHSDSHYRKYIGVDVLHQNFPSLKEFPFVLYDGQHLPFKDRSIDATYLIDVLHHLPDSFHIRKCLQEITRITKNRIIIHDYVYETHLQLQLLKVTDELTNCQFSIKCPMSFLKKAEWEDLFNKIAFQGNFKRLRGDVGGDSGFWWIGIRCKGE